MMMKALITGATGFLGRAVVAALRDRGRAVRAVVRGGTAPGHAEPFEADLEAASVTELAPAFEGVDVMVHLAARLSGDDDALRRLAVESTRRLLDAMVKQGGCRRVVLASSLSVYDVARCGGELTEQTPTLEGGALAAADGYARAKVEQERLVRRVAAERGWTLTVLRPGPIWGAGRLDLPQAAQRIGPLRVTFSPDAVLPLTYVENCADAFAVAAQRGEQDAEDRELIANVVDGDGPTRRAYLTAVRGLSGGGGRGVNVPYAVGRTAAALLGPLAKLGLPVPGSLRPRRLEAYHRPVRVSGERGKEMLGWEPRYRFEEALARCEIERDRIDQAGL